MARITCLVCGVVAERDGRGNPRFCATCGLLQLRECERAARAVHRAIFSGLLPHVKNCTCKDCGAPARAYDHRDYTKPLEVDPVCTRCNTLRGPAFNSQYRPQRAH